LELERGIEERLTEKDMTCIDEIEATGMCSGMKKKALD
jgi:hypothetical protein